MTVVKSDAMMQYEKGIADLVGHKPKQRNDNIMHIEWSKYFMAAAAILVVVIAIASMMM
jgi:hypothetical protein